MHAHLLVYNLIRASMAEAGVAHGVPPRELSFQGARQVLEGFRPELATAPTTRAESLRAAALEAIAGGRVGGSRIGSNRGVGNGVRRCTRDYICRGTWPESV